MEIGKSAIDILKIELETENISLCEGFNGALSNGIKLGAITEFCGFAGSGKTQICLQLCVNSVIQYQDDCGAVFIDTKNAVFPERLEQMIENKILQTKIKSISVENMLERIFYKTCKDASELVQIVTELKSWIDDDTNKIKLIVIDSFAVPFRNFTNTLRRMKIIYMLLNELQKLADKHQCAIVITNDITTRLKNNDSLIVPALGESYHHRVTQRVLLGSTQDKDNETFCAQIQKNLWNAKSELQFVIGKNGVQDLNLN